MSEDFDIIDPHALRALIPGLQGAWFIDERYLLPSGDLRDVSGQGHHGTPTAVQLGQRSLAPGLVGGSGFADGVSSDISFGAAPALDPAAGLSVLSWVLPENWSAGATTQWELRDANNHHVILYMDGSDVVLRIADTGGTLGRVTVPDKHHSLPLFCCTYVIHDGTRWSWTLQVLPAGAGWIADSGTMSREATDAATITPGLLSWGGSTNYFHGAAQAFAMASGEMPPEKLDALSALAGFDAPLPAYYQPFYVSDYPDSPRRYFAEYVSDYLDAIGKPAVDVWPKRRYGVATARGVKGAYDGTFLGDTTGDGVPVADDYGQSIATKGTDNNSRFTVPHAADLSPASPQILTFFRHKTGRSERFINKRESGSSTTIWGTRTEADDSLAAFFKDDAGNQQSVSFAGPISEGGHLVGLSYDNATDTTRLALDGVEVDRDTAPALGDLTLNDHDITSGYSGGVPAEGEVSAIAITGTPLTDEEQLHLYEAVFDRTKRLSKSELEALSAT